MPVTTYLLMLLLVLALGGATVALISSSPIMLSVLVPVALVAALLLHRKRSRS